MEGISQEGAESSGAAQKETCGTSFTDSPIDLTNKRGRSTGAEKGLRIAKRICAALLHQRCEWPAAEIARALDMHEHTAQVWSRKI
jgi:hypothetical protein